MRYSIALLVAVFIAGGATAVAQPGPGAHHPPMMRRGHGEMMAKLGLSDKQKAEMAKLHTELEKSMVGIQSKIKLARIDLKTLVAADSPDKAAIESKMKEVSDIQYQAKKAVVDHAFESYALLTPEQQKTFRQGMLKMLTGGMGRMGARGGMQRGWGGAQGGMGEGDTAPR